MRTFSLHLEQWLPRPVEEVFPFFADARNLQTITPDWLHFNILSTDLTMRVGLRIDYRLKWHGLPLRWQSEITAWEPPHRFVDEQRRGPYRLWIHEHLFRPHQNGTLVVDDVKYAVWGGRLAQALGVRRDLEKIFAFRQSVIARRFSGNPSASHRQ